MADRIVVTFAAKDNRRLPWLVEGDQEPSGMPVPLPDGLSGVIRNPPIVIRESAVGPDLWTSVIQVVVEHSDTIATAVAGSLLAAWIKRKLGDRDQPETPSVNIDQSVHNDVRVFIAKVEVGANPEKIAEAVRDAFDGQAEPIELPRAIREEMAAKAGMTLEEYDDWVEDED
jgi:hypothetical protein